MDNPVISELQLWEKEKLAPNLSIYPQDRIFYIRMLIIYPQNALLSAEISNMIKKKLKVQEFEEKISRDIQVHSRALLETD